MKKTLSKTQKILRAIQRTKRGLTTETIRERFDITNVSAFINDLRRTGHTVQSVSVNGVNRWVA
jgi:hypothetical protein